MTPQAVIHRTELPIDDRPHGIDLTGDILHTAIRRPGAVDVWYQARPDGMEPMRRSFQIVGTGQPVPTHLGFYVTHKGTAISPNEHLVWHVLENHCPHVERPGSMPTLLPGDCPNCLTRLAPDEEFGWRPG